jgi:polyhydroxyalkanoate synthesis repressor PhaR
MVRLVKRYGSRKLYDTEESRYVSLAEIAAFIRRGQEIRVVDNATAEDVTGQTLTQVIVDEARRGAGAVTADLLHELIRLGGQAVSTGVTQVHERVTALVRSSVGRLQPLRRARAEMAELRLGLEALEESLARFEKVSGAGQRGKRKGGG